MAIPLPKNVLAPFGVTAAISEIDAGKYMVQGPRI